MAVPRCSGCKIHTSLCILTGSSLFADTSSRRAHPPLTVLVCVSDGSSSAEEISPLPEWRRSPHHRSCVCACRKVDCGSPIVF
ncbi:hypothetical protein M758_UG252100 [Ceratodon purpureus]|nr:hypothetical protein M758_UG252100 [Ceratodon purpureus]